LVIDLSEKETIEKDRPKQGILSKIQESLFGRGKEEPKESENVTFVKDKPEQSLLSKIQDTVLFGKGTREDLKEFDMQLREDYHKTLIDLRKKWEEIYLQILDSQQPSLNRKAKTVIQTLDRIKEQVNRATYGYAPLFNRVGQIESSELQKVLDYDKEFGEYLNQLRESEDNVAKSVEEENWDAVTDGVSNVKNMLDDIEKRWNEREKYFRSKEM
jgi:hypothetical protein